MSLVLTTARACSCPAAIYHPGTRCKHSRKYFPQPEQEANLRDGLPGWPGGDIPYSDPRTTRISESDHRRGGGRPMMPT